MAYNLIDERWIPVERKSGKVEMIAPAQVADREDPPLRIASPRPDFDGALLEFLVGLVQTAAAPANERAWEKEFETPPSVETLKKRFDKVKEAFFLDGDGPRFMQETTLTPENAKHKEIGYLLVSRAGEDNIGEGPSLFTKAGQVPALSNAAAAAALFAMQSRAPSGGGGGGGHFTSVRGGSALSGVIIGAGLWESIFLNVIPSSVFCPDEADSVPGPRVFPWLGKIRSGNKKTGLPTPVSSVHPAHAYWALPRRLLLSELDDSKACAVYAGADRGGWTGLRTATAGMRYEGLMHPLAAYSRKSESDPWLPFLAPGGGFTYREWPTLAVPSALSQPPRVVSYFASTRRRQLVTSPRLAAFGYAMDSMKPLRWCCAETPLITVDRRFATDFGTDLDALVAVSEDVRSTICGQIRAAWSERPKALNFSDVAARIDPAFWSVTEPAFFRAVHATKEGLEADDAKMRDTARKEWLADLHRAALTLFDTFAEAPPDLAAPDLRRTVLARRDLEQFTRPSSPKLRKLLGLAIDESDASRKTAKSSNQRKESSP